MNIAPVLSDSLHHKILLDYANRVLPVMNAVMSCHCTKSGDAGCKE